MTSERWQLVDRLYHAALVRPEDSRAAFLAEACADDAALRREVESLLAHEPAAVGFMSTPAVVAAGGMPGAGESLTGRQLGPYAIHARLGTGGMSEVYRARDTRLGRDVAIKVLTAPIAGDPQSRERFQREARAVAALNHPHICTLHDIGSQDSLDFLVMEYLEGETLAARLAKAPLASDRALQYAVQIASALDKAHRAGIIHRDLKPSNIFLVRNSGTSAPPTAKLLDFGLAKLRPTAKTVAGMSAVPAGGPPLTARGTLLGTLQYMAPEQVEGKETDARTDIFAFGAVLFEMLTGTRAFQGDSDASLMVAILEREPPLASTLQPLVPPTLDRIIDTCLAKDPDDRWQTARDLLREVTWIVESKPPQEAARAHAGRGWPRRGLATAAIVASLAVGGVLGWTLTRATARGNKAVTRVSLSVAPAEQIGEQSPPSVRPSRTAIALSPDGRTLVFSGTTGTTTQLFMRQLDHSSAAPIAGTEGANGPFFSPDGQWVGFWARGKLRKTPIAGGPAIDICETQIETLFGLPGALFGASWGSNEMILFSRGRDIATVPASGGTPLVVATADPQRRAAVLSSPQWLPGGKTILYTARASADWTEAQVVTQSLDGGDPRALLSGAADARYVSTGHLLYLKLGTLLAVPFDPARVELSGAPVAMIEGVMQAVNTPYVGDETGAGQYDVASDGTLAYVVGGIQPEVKNQLVWVDRRGVESPLKVPPGPILFPRVSPDGHRLAYIVRRRASRESDVWTYDLRRDTPARLTSVGDNNQPVWSPDGRRVIFSSGLPRNLFWTAADGSGSPERLTTSPLSQYASSASPSNLVAVVDVDGRRDAPSQISVLSLEGDGKPQPFPQSPFALRFPAFSNTGRWLAYMSLESGRSEVYVQAFPDRSAKHRISTEIGHAPVWAPNGRELFYMQGTPPTPITMMAVDIDTTTGFPAARPHALFTGPYIAAVPVRNYDVSPDSQRFIMAKDVGEREKPPSSIEIVLNWTEELKRLAPPK